MFRGLSVSVSSFVSKDLSDKNSKKSNPKNQNHFITPHKEGNQFFAARTIERVREKEREREKRVRARGKE